MTALQNFFGDLAPFEIFVSVVAIATALYTFYKNAIERANVSAHTGDTVGIVSSSDGNIQKLQLMLSLVNHGTKIGTVEQLELSLTTPTGRSAVFIWSLFFRYSDNRDNMVLLPETDPYPVAVPPKSTIPRFVEFKLRTSEEEIIWDEGEYKIEMYGWVNRASRADRINLRRTFHFNMSPGDLNELKLRSQKAQKDRMSIVGRLSICEWSSKRFPT